MTDETDQSIIGDSSGEKPGTESSQVQADYPKPVPDSDRFAGPFPGKTTFSGSVPNLSQIPVGDRIVEIWESKTKLVASVPLSSDGRWTATLDTVDGKPFYAAKLVKGSAYFDFGSLMYTAPLKVLTINQPAKDWVGAFPTISGTNAYPLATVKLYRDGDGNTVYGSTTASVLGTFSIRVTGVSPASVMDFTCRQSWGDVHSQWAPAVKFKLLAPPTVEIPAGSIGLLASISGTATGASSGTKVNVYRDLSNEKLCIGLPHLIQRWQGYFTSAMKPGVVKVRAQQDDRGVLSEPSPLYTLRVHPNAPVISEIRWSNLATIFKGNGYSGATVEIYPESGQPIYTNVVNPQGVFERDIVVLPGTYKGWKIRQKIQEGGDWIFSPYSSSEIKFDVPTPAPTVNTPTLIGQIPTVTGRGSIWQGLAAAKIEVVLKGTTDIEMGEATVTATGDWTATTATAVPPGSYTVSVRQLMNEVYSQAVTAPEPLIIKPLAPLITSKVVEDFSPRIKGTCWPEAILSLTYTGATTHSVSSANGEWEFRREDKFEPGQYSFSVMQTFGGQASVAAGPETFTIETPKPVITFPGNQQETDFRPEIKGKNGYPGATVAVFDNKVGGPALVQTIVPPSGEWVIKLDKDLALGAQDLYALQTFKTQASERSVSALFNVMVPVPTLTPAAKGYYPRYSEFEGKGYTGAVVKLIINGAIYETPTDVVVDEDGLWKVLVYQSEVGVKTLQITQTYAGGIRETIQTTFITGTNAPDVESPEGGAWVDPVNAFFAGHGHPDDTVIIRRADTHENLGSTLVNERRQWSVHVKTLEGDTKFGVYAYSARSSVGGDPSATKVINLQDLAAPRFVYPFAGLVHISTMLFSGWGIPGAIIWIVDAFNPEIALAPNALVDENGKWSTHSYKDFTKGPHWVKAQQKKDGQESPWVLSGRFIVETPLSGFMRPFVLRPYPGAQVGRKPRLAGIGVVGAMVYIFLGGKELCQALVGANGCWSASLPELAVGSTTLRVVQARHGYWSEDAKPPTFEVIQFATGFEAPTLSVPVEGAAVDTRFWMRGTGTPGAEIIVQKNGDHGTIYARVYVDAYGDWLACINKPLPPGAFKFGAKQVIDGVESLYCQNITVTVVDALPAPTLESHLNGEQIAPVTTMHGRGFPKAKIQVRDVTDGNFVLCEAVVDEEGYWESVTQNLPLRFIRVTAWQVLSPKPNSPWMTEIGVTVVNAG
jgi:hypothetical protein